jgi:hypothetical protein
MASERYWLDLVNKSGVAKSTNPATIGRGSAMHDLLPKTPPSLIGRSY